MNKKFTVIMSVIEIILHSAIFLTGMVVICYEPLSYRPEEYVLCLLVIPAVVLAWCMRHIKISNRKFYMAHAIPVIATIIMGRSDNEKFLICILMLVLAGYSSYIMYRNEHADKEKPSYVMLAVMLFAFISGQSYGSKIVVYTAIVSTVVFVILSVLYDNLFRMKLVFRENAEMSDFPARRLIKVNVCIMVFTVLAILAAMFISGRIGSGDFTFLSRFGAAVARVVAIFVIWIIEMLGKFQDRAPQGAPRPEEDVSDRILEYMTEGSDGTIERLINAAIAVIAIIILIAVFAALFRALNRFMRKERVKTEGNDVIEFIKDENRESTIRTRKVRKERQAVSDNDRFRKMYRRAVKKGMRKNGTKTLPASMTPTEITDSNITKETALSAKITNAYEIARYSNESVTKEQIETLKSIGSK